MKLKLKFEKKDLDVNRDLQSLKKNKKPIEIMKILLSIVKRVEKILLKNKHKLKQTREKEKRKLRENIDDTATNLKMDSKKGVKRLNDDEDEAKNNKKQLKNVNTEAMETKEEFQTSRKNSKLPKPKISLNKSLTAPQTINRNPTTQRRISLKLNLSNTTEINTNKEPRLRILQDIENRLTSNGIENNSVNKSENTVNLGRDVTMNDEITKTIEDVITKVNINEPIYSTPRKSNEKFCEEGRTPKTSNEENKIEQAEIEKDDIPYVYEEKYKKRRSRSDGSKNDDHLTVEQKAENEKFEEKYHRGKYEFTLAGPSLNNFKDIYSRVSELEKYTGINDPILIQPNFDDETGTHTLTIAINSLHQYRHLMANFPKDMFGDGITVTDKPPTLPVIIQNVDKNLRIDQNEKGIIDLAKRYGLVDIERIFLSDKTPSSKIRGNVLTLFNYIDLLQNGIYLDISSMRHKVKPSILFARACIKCGSLSHGPRECRFNEKCLRCGMSDHTIETCKNSANCVNCNGKHQCNSELCDKLINKTLANNKYVLNLMVNEKILESPEQILNIPKSSMIPDNQTIDNKQLENLINDILESKLTQQNKRLNDLEESSLKHSKDIFELKTDVREIKTEISKFNITLDSLSSKTDTNSLELKTIKSTINNNHKETHSFLEQILGKMTQQGKLSIATINIGGINNNNSYLNELVLNNNIVCVQETWATNKSSIEKNIYVLNKKIFFTPAIKLNKKGRPSGGLACIIDINIKCTYQQMSNRIGILYLPDIIIINVYFPYYTGSFDQNQEFGQEIMNLEEILNLNPHKEIIILGDLNTDIIRKNHFSIELINFLMRNHLTLSDIVQCQEIDYTYRKIVDLKVQSSWIDHVICKKDSLHKLETNILNNYGNLGDHNAICTKIKIPTNNQLFQAVKINNKTKLNWTNKRVQQLYQMEIDKDIKRLEEAFRDLKIVTDKKLLRVKLSEAINQLNSLLLNATSRVSKKITHISKSKKRKIGQMKFKKWWDDKIQQLHSIVIEKYIKYRLSNFSQKEKKEFNEAKKSFRKQKRYNLKMRRDGRTRRINAFFKLDSQRFWSKIRNLQKNKSSIDIDINSLRSHYENIFTVRNKEGTFQDALNDKYVKEFINKYSNKKFSYKIDINILNEKIQNLHNNKSIGISDISNEMLKYAKCTTLLEHIKTLFETMINNFTMPFIFNTSILKPIVKDQKKNTNDINNLRPVAISDCLSNIFESILLNALQVECKDHPKQFGFKSNSSCNHAIWTLKQAIEICKHSKKRLYVCAIDASRAFDKINRTILWKRLIDKNLSPEIILSLIAYYNDSYTV
ncbi:unnamed protein product [Brachionus calyciflorus]|uniref:Reverse transcriptase domain-containing protein n=1 Tax=Brachionus calyciflorus TaxID=104777 RepID=A0A814LF32_9BILA|nr:unnamed protein product [Brachionus calyciflorus]